MSMIDAASSGVPLIVSDQIGEPDRARGNGVMYEENDVSSLCAAILGLRDPAERRKLGKFGREKMLRGFSWMEFARTVESDFLDAVSSRDLAPGRVLLEGE
jgi:glycosyltransferase involved in cell wall biosynthesis